MHERDLWLLIPICTNLFWLFASIIAGGVSFPHDGLACLMVAFLTSGVAVVGIMGFVVKDVTPTKAFLTLIGQTCILVLVYAVIYFHRLNVPNLSFPDALYYSVTTWTGLGFADLAPTREMRAVTAAQAITGYLYLGLLVSVLSSVVGRTTADQR
jgi:hypothetical protein